MTSSRPLRLLVLPAKPFPCDHAMLENVFAQGLPRRGHRVRWVMPAQPGTPPGSYPWHGSTVRVVRGSSGGLGALLTTIGTLLGVIRELGRGVDVVVVRNTVRLAAPLVMLRRIGGPPVVYQFSFPVAERRLALGGAALPARLSLRLRRRVLATADLILAISETMRQQLITDRLVRTGSVISVPLGAEASLPRESEVARVREDLALGSAPLILYFGAVAPERRLGFLIEVARGIARTHPDARWLVMGPASGGEDRRLTDLARDLGDRFRVVGPVPRSQVAAYVAASSVTVSPIPPDPLFRASSPTKTAESLGWGTPVVVTPIPDQVDLVERTGGGLVAPFEPTAFADAIRQLLDDPEAAEAMGAGARERVLSERSYDVLTDRVESAIRGLVDPLPLVPERERI